MGSIFPHSPILKSFTGKSFFNKGKQGGLQNEPWNISIMYVLVRFSLTIIRGSESHLPGYFLSVMKIPNLSHAFRHCLWANCWEPKTLFQTPSLIWGLWAIKEQWSFYISLLEKLNSNPISWLFLTVPECSILSSSFRSRQHPNIDANDQNQWLYRAKSLDTSLAIEQHIINLSTLPC